MERQWSPSSCASTRVTCSMVSARQEQHLMLGHEVGALSDAFQYLLQTRRDDVFVLQALRQQQPCTYL